MKATHQAPHSNTSKVSSTTGLVGRLGHRELRALQAVMQAMTVDDREVSNGKAPSYLEEEDDLDNPVTGSR